jgi:glycosyltransferase involved in cell wall biosynthesis
MSRPLVTIVTPSFNQARFLRAAIESVLSQDYPAVEYIVMDGGSTDGSAGVAAEYSGRLNWISEKDRGQAHAINKGFQRARGDIVAWLNSDDLLLPGAVRAAVEALERAPGAGGVYGGGVRIDAEGREIGPFEATRDFDLWRLVWLEDYILQPSCFFPRRAVHEVGMLDESLNWTMDWDLLIRLGLRFGLVRVPRDMAAIREYEGTKTSTGGRARLKEIRALLKKHTGARRAPGYWLYLLNQWRDHAGWAPAAKALTLAIDRIHGLAQGLDPAMMAGPRCRFMAPAGTEWIRIQGRASGYGGGLELRVVAEGAELSRVRTGAGEFEILAPAPAASAGRAVLFEVHASGGRLVWPGLEFHLAHRVCWRLMRLSFIRAGGAEI